MRLVPCPLCSTGASDQAKDGYCCSRCGHPFDLVLWLELERQKLSAPLAQANEESIRLTEEQWEERERQKSVGWCTDCGSVGIKSWISGDNRVRGHEIFECPNKNCSNYENYSWAEEKERERKQKLAEESK